MAKLSVKLPSLPLPQRGGDVQEDDKVSRSPKASPNMKLVSVRGSQPHKSCGYSSLDPVEDFAHSLRSRFLKMHLISPRWLPQNFEHVPPRPKKLASKLDVDFDSASLVLRLPAPLDKIMELIPQDQRPELGRLRGVIKEATIPGYGMASVLVSDQQFFRLSQPPCWNRQVKAMCLKGGHVTSIPMKASELAAAAAVHHVGCRHLHLGAVGPDVDFGMLMAFDNLQSLMLSRATRIPEVFPNSIQTMWLEFEEPVEFSNKVSLPSSLRRLSLRGASVERGLLRLAAQALNLTWINCAFWTGAPVQELVSLHKLMASRKGMFAWPSAYVFSDATEYMETEERTEMRYEAALMAKQWLDTRCLLSHRGLETAKKLNRQLRRSSTCGSFDLRKRNASACY